MKNNKTYHVCYLSDIILLIQGIMIVYLIKCGQTTIGRSNSIAKKDLMIVPYWMWTDNNGNKQFYWSK